MQTTVKIEGEDDFLRKLQQAQDWLKSSDVLEVIGVESINHFKQSFEDEGFTDRSLEKWKTRETKRLTRNNSKALSDKGELVESIDYRISGNTVIIFSDKPYAQIHNEGGTIDVTPKMRSFFLFKMQEAISAGSIEVAEFWRNMFFCDQIKMPKRQFIGKSDVLDAKVIDKIMRELDNIFKQ